MRQEYKVAYILLFSPHKRYYPLLQMRKLRLRAMKSCACGFTLPSAKARVWTRDALVSPPMLLYFWYVCRSVVSISLWPHGLLGSRKPARFLCPWNSPGKNTGVGGHSLLRGIFTTQGLNPCLLHCRQILYHLSHRGSPNYIKSPHNDDIFYSSTLARV